MDEEEDETLVSLHYKKYLKTDPNFIPEDEDSSTRWGDDFYSNIRSKIHAKLKTQPSDERRRLNKKLTIMPKKKQKITVSTLEIALDPVVKRIHEANGELDNKICKHIQKTKRLTNSRNSKVSRNPSLTLAASSHTTALKESSSSKQIESCRRLMQRGSANSSVNRAQTPSSFVAKLKSDPPEDATQYKKYQKNYSATTSEFYPLSHEQQRISTNKSAGSASVQKISIKRSVSEKKATLVSVNEDKPIVTEPLKKKELSPTKCREEDRKSLKIQNFNTDGLLFYFKAKNSLKASNRELNIKRIRHKGSKVLI